MKNDIRRFSILLLSLVLLSVAIFSFTRHIAKVAIKPGISKCLVVSDIHFNPLFGSSEKDSVLKKKLATWSFNDWKKYFESTPAEMELDSTLLFKDANYAVLTSAIANMKKKLPHPAFIVIAGDFIWHGAIPADSLIKKKSLLFIARLFKENFPGTLIIPAMGNNDTYGNDYDLQDSKFLKDFANAWMPNLPTPSADSLKKNSYYTCEDGNLKFIVINSALVQAQGNYPQSAAMLKWLNKTLANANGKNVWIITHIPPGLNSFNDKDFWKKSEAQEFVNTVVKYAPTVKLMICSHTHFDDFKVFYDNSGSRAPVAFLRIVPSVCSNHGNYPSFEVAEFNPVSGKLDDETSWYLNLAKALKGVAPEMVEWRDSINIKKTLNLAAINATTLSQFMTILKTDTSGPAMKNYATFYDVGTPISSLTINKKTYKKYLKADSLKGN
jgi:sphingomyelin phosphodiesterase acid-like 3